MLAPNPVAVTLNATSEVIPDTLGKVASFSYIHHNLQFTVCVRFFLDCKLHEAVTMSVLFI